MKARFLFLAAVMLGLASCQTEPEGLDVNVGGEEQIVTVNVNVPETETRAAGSDSALGVFDNGVLGTADDSTTMRYILQVYYKDGENFVKSEERKVEYSDGKSVAFDVRLVPERDYQFVVWADVVVNGKTDTDNHYNTADLTNVTLNNTWVAMDESRDAFTATEFIDNFNSSKVINITLKRPFAKLRVVTTDIKNLTNLGIVPTTATVEYTTTHRVAFNAFEGKAADASESKTHSYTINPYSNETNTGAEYTLFTDYFFAENDVVKFNFNVYEDEAKTKLIKENNFVTDINVKRNHLTTIKGNILTDGKGFDVSIEDGFENGGGTNPDYEYATITSAVELLRAIGTSGNYIVMNDIKVTEADVLVASTLAATRSTTTTTTINLNGFTITIANDSNEPLVTLEEGEKVVFAGDGAIEKDPNTDGDFIDNSNDNTEVVFAGADYDEEVFTKDVTDYAAGLVQAFTTGGEYTLEANVTLNKSLTLAAGKTLTLNLNGKTLSNSTEGKTNPQDFILVKGNLTVYDGTITVEHIGENMGWNGQGTIFNITAGGVVNLNGVIAKYLGGTDMNFVAHLNNWGEATFNAVNCTLEATYIAVRAFNSGPDMNNVAISNSTLKGKYCFWVHNYNEAGDNCGTDATLNIDIYNGNTFEYTGKAPILYGFNEPLYFNAEGKLLAFNIEDLKKFIGKDNQRSKVALANDMEISEALTVEKTLTLDLNGKTITGTDASTGSFGLITNKGDLTVKNGTMTLTAENNRAWNAYSSVISNTVGGNLVVENVTIEHLGGTDMAYGIDNLTNGKGTSAVATINEGAIVKSTYRAIRQFLNGVEANNSLTVNAGAVVEGNNKSIWMQDPSANANTGTLVVNEGATLNGDVYLYVCEGSAEWPVSVSIAASAVNGEVLTGNVPERYKVVEENGVWTVVNYVAKIGEVGYTSLAMAVAAVKDGETITLVADEVFTENNYYDNGGWKDGLGCVGDKSFTLDLNGYTISQNGALNDYLLYFKNNGSKDNTITIKNGTLDAGTTAYSALCTASANEHKITINIEDINLVGNNSNGAVAKIRGGSELNVNAGTVITGKNNYVGIEAVGNNTVVNIYDNVNIYQNGTSSYVGGIVGASYNATMNIYGGYGKSAKCGIIVMSTGATINVSGGEWIANNDGTVANGNNGVLVSQNNRYETGWACKSILNVTGGTFKGGYDCWGSGPGVEPDDAQINIKGGNFNSNPANYVVTGYESVEENGVWTVGK